MTIDDAFIESLLSRPEGETLDFKQAQYAFSSNDKKDQKRIRAEFVKDIVAMYNTPRDAPSFIVLGVRKYLDGKSDITGVTSHVDDAELQSKFNDWVYPTPHFIYQPYSYRGDDIAIITIPVNHEFGPCLALKDLPSKEKQVLRQHQLYIRKGSVNDCANLEEQKKVYAWFRGELAETSSNTREAGPWDGFLDEVHDFSSDFYFGLLITEHSNGPDDFTAALGLVDWAFVLDFDRDTDIDGLLSRCRTKIASRRSVHIVTKGESPALNIDRGTYWYCANGLSGRSETIPRTDKWADWNRMYGLDIQQLLGSIAAATTARPVVLVVLWASDTRTDELRTVLTSAAAMFAESLTIVIVTPEPSGEIARLCESFECQHIVVPTAQLCLGIQQLLDNPGTVEATEVTLPSTSGAPLPIPRDRTAWLSEELQILHLGEGRNVEGLLASGSEFLRGNEISWYELGLNYDVPRELTSKAIRVIRADLGSRRPLRVSLYHAPGAGGTTVARRIMWDLRNDFPCMLLLRTTPKETCERLTYIAGLTGKSMLVVADAGAITDREADALYEVIAATHLPVVLLQVDRRYGQPSSQKRGLYLGCDLDVVEAPRFKHFLQREKPESASALEEVLRDSKPGTLTPFYLALVAFGRDFVRLNDYVSRRLDGLTEAQKRCLAYLAIAHYFGQRSIPVQMFADAFGLPPSRPVKLEKLLPESALELLAELRPNHWRTVHPLVAEECMRQIFTSMPGDTRIWLQQLSSWSLKFVEFCRGEAPIATDEGLDLARRVYVFRDNSEILGSERAGMAYFSEALEQIPSAEGRLEVLRQLTNNFPEEAHFWAHLGRFLSTAMKEHQQACDAVDHAISLQPRDHVLHHMRGMVQRARVYEMISNKAPLADVVTQAESAAAAFARARELDPDDEHGYISDAQMCLRILDYCGALNNTDAIRAASNASSPKWVREAMQGVEELLSHVRQNREGERASRFEEACRAELDVMYGDYGTALQRWDAMLNRSDVYRPPIRRQIVWAYLSRHNRKWDQLRQNEVDRSLRLLSENLDEEPNNERNLRLWLQAIRVADPPPNLDTVIEKLSYWHANADSLEPVYYLFVMYSLKAFEGSSLARDKAERALEECRVKSRYRRNRSKSFEWLGEGEGLRRVVHQDALGDWDRDIQFWTDPSLLLRINGVIRRIQGPEAGEIETELGLRAFYVPARADHFKGESENRRVTCYIGFSYDGLRAWSVESVK